MPRIVIRPAVAFAVAVSAIVTSRRRRAALAAALLAVSLPVLAETQLDRPPPPPMYDPHGMPPDGKFWVPGYWEWNGTKYDWVDGHFEVKRPGMRYTAPHWEAVGNHVWTLREGQWQQSDWGPGTTHDIRSPD